MRSWRISMRTITARSRRRPPGSSAQAESVVEVEEVQVFGAEGDVDLVAVLRRPPGLEASDELLAALLAATLEVGERLGIVDRLAHVLGDHRLGAGGEVHQD